jgi:hypothetical protein
MPNLMPGAVWKPVKNGGAGRPARRKGRGVCLHVAVSESSSLAGYFATADADSHFYVTKAGVIEQYVDADVIAWANTNGNATLLSVETQGGVTNAELEPWTPEQIEALARICAWAHNAEGVPLSAMPDSLAASRGIGYHRLGIDPWRVAGGESWSSARGKICPGAAKVAQIPQIIARANVLVGVPATPPPAPAIPPTPAQPGWPLPAGHWLGDVHGPARSHGGDPRYDGPATIAAIQWVQRRLIAKGYVPGVRDWRSGWADGKFEAPTVAAVAAWQRAEMPGTQFYGQVWSDDYRALAR